MIKKEMFCQVGICPNCSSQTRQQFLFATNDYMEPPVSTRKVAQYEIVRTLSMFRCEGCRAFLLFETKLENPLTLAKDEWLVDLSSHDFLTYSRLISSTKSNYLQMSMELLGLNWGDLPAVVKDRFYRENPIVHPAAPRAVKRSYEIGVAVRPMSSELYALQLRKTLEAICKEQGASQYDSNGRWINLFKQIEELREKNLLGSYIAEAAQDLRRTSNLGAHYTEEEVNEEDIRRLEHVLALVTFHLYGSSTLSIPRDTA